MRVLMGVVLLAQIACNFGGSRVREQKAEPPARSSTEQAPAKSERAGEARACEQDLECAQALERLAAGTFAPAIDLLQEINTHFSGPEAGGDDTSYRALKTLTLPASRQALKLFATPRIGSGACFSFKLVDAKTGRTAWQEEGLCDVRVLGITDKDTLVKIASLPDSQQSHAAPHRLQITYYVWDAATAQLDKRKVFETRQRF